MYLYPNQYKAIMNQIYVLGSGNCGEVINNNHVTTSQHGSFLLFSNDYENQINDYHNDNNELTEL